MVWGLWQESEQIQPLLDAFEAQTGVKVDYQKRASVATYEKELLEALAQGRGPDVFVIHHTWVEGKRGLMSPAPPEVIDERAVQDEFVEVVRKDVVRDGFVYALPTSVDTLALYVNNDLLNANAVPGPPATWEKFSAAVQSITRVTRTGQLQQSAAALGTADNVNRASDIVQLLMLQSGLSITNDEGEIDFTQPAGETALTFYTDFANKSKKVFTWEDVTQDFSIDAFSEQETAMMINYSYHIPTVRSKQPRLNFSIAPVPQIGGTQNPRAFASYWPFAVSNTSRAPVTAWQLVRFLTSKEASETLNKAQVLPPARLDSIETFARDPILGPFAQQSLIAATWPRVDILAADGIFNRMVNSVIKEGVTVPEALRSGADQLEQLITTPPAGAAPAP